LLAGQDTTGQEIPPSPIAINGNAEAGRCARHCL
jgi:hypothetical protein